MNPVRPKPAGKPMDLEKGLAELEGIVAQLESGELALEKSLKEFERGVRLSRECEAALKDAAQRVEILAGGELKAFAAPDDDEDAGDTEDD